VTSTEILKIEALPSRNLGRCYNAYPFRVTSSRTLSGNALRALREVVGVFGYGQEFSYHQVDSEGRKIGSVPDELSMKNPPPSTKIDDRVMYIYLVESRVDSSD
jgi:hypothetical protein